MGPLLRSAGRTSPAGEHHSRQHDPEKGRTVMRLANKVAIISGAASGMGAATARAKGPGWSSPTCWNTKAGKWPMPLATRRG